MQLTTLVLLGRLCRCLPCGSGAGLGHIDVAGVLQERTTVRETNQVNTDPLDADLWVPHCVLFETSQSSR